MKKTEVQITALSNSESSPGNFSLVLEEVHGKRKVVLIIGPFEAQSIAIHSERMQLLRPITHDLFKNTIVALGGQLKEVFIHTVEEGIFHASLIILQNGEEKVIDARASDALSLAIRFNSTIFITDDLFAQFNVQPPADKFQMLRGSLAEYSLDELEVLLQDVLAKEDYESAGRIRDMIARRKGNI